MASTASKIFFIGGFSITVKRGDITEEGTDAIVNAANTGMSMGGGVAYAIKRRGGEEIEKEAEGKAPAGLGKVISTKAGKLPSRHILHAATMSMDFRTDLQIVREAAKNSLLEAEKLGIRSISFPALGCGTGRLGVEKAAPVMVEEALRIISGKSSLRDIRFLLYSGKDFEDFCLAAEKYLASFTQKTCRNPVPTVDIIIEKDGGIVLVKRKNYPYGWALPGGFVDYGESLEDAAAREAREETGLSVEWLKQFHTYSRPGRDPRYHTISTVFTAKGEGRLKAADDAAKAEIFNVSDTPKNLAFDHGEILEEYYGK